jgi:O-antigen/teichoic acid export membrane protein
MSAPPGASTRAASTSPDAVLSARATAGGIAALGGGEIASRLVAFATTVLLARRVGADGFGMLAFATALTGYCALLVGGGLNDLAARNVARDPDDAPATYRSVLAVRLPLALIAIGLILLVAWFIPRPSIQRIVLALSGLSVLTLALDPLWAVKALRHRLLAACAQAGSQVLILIGVAALVHGAADLVLVPLVQFVGEAAIAVALAVVVLRVRSPAGTSAEGWRLFRESLPLLFGRGMRAVIVSFDIVLLGFLASSHAVGVYAAVYRLHFFILALVVAIQAAYLPLMSQVAVSRPAELRVISDEALASAAVVGAPLVAGGVLVAGPLLALLFGQPYAEGALALQWLLVSLIFVFVHGLLHNVYVVTGRTHLETRWFALGAGLNVLANLWLIPRFGIAGAAAATALAEGAIVAAGVFLTRIVPPSTVLTAWLKPGCAAGIMAAGVWATRQVLPLPAQLAVGAVVYTAAMIGLVGPRAMAIRFGWLR